jgi:hypothetical protein
LRKTPHVDVGTIPTPILDVQDGRHLRRRSGDPGAALPPRRKSLREPAPPIDITPIAEEHHFRLTTGDCPSHHCPEQAELWALQIPCKRGYIATHSDRELSAVCTEKKFRSRLLTVPTIRVVDDNEKQLRVAFDPSLARIVGAILKAKFLPRPWTDKAATPDVD